MISLFTSLSFIAILGVCSGFSIHGKIGNSVPNHGVALDWEADNWANNYIQTAKAMVYERGHIVNWFKEDFEFEYCNGLKVTREEAAKTLDDLPAGTSLKTALTSAYFHGDYLEARFTLSFHSAQSDSPTFDVSLQVNKRTNKMTKGSVNNCDDL